MLDKVFKNKLFTYIYTSVLFLLACMVPILNKEIDGVILFAYIASAMMVLSSRLTDAMLPAILICVFATRCYNSADLFIARIPFFVPVVLAVIAHFVIYREKYLKNIRFGRSFSGLCAVTLSVTLGGLGTIPVSDYFAGGALYYVFGLGIGMVLFYLIVKANFTEESGREVARIMYVMGLFACFCVLRFYAADWSTFIETKKLLVFQSSNNLSTFLMIAMPFPLFYSSRRFVDVLSVFLMYVCTLLSGSRGGLMMGTVELVVIFLAFAVYDNNHLFNRIFYILIVVTLGAALIINLPRLADFYKLKLETGAENPGLWDYISALKNYLISDNETRVDLLKRMFSDFETNPLFGVGIGYTGNSDIYNPVKGAMNWYHMWFAQVVGGLGLLGIVAFGYQLVNRIVTFFRNMSLLNFTFLMSYIGLFMMSQVNPGEFCPMPYAALAVTFFVSMERKEDDIDFSTLKKRIKKKLRLIKNEQA